MTNTNKPYSRKSKGVFEQEQPVPSPFDDAADHTIDAKDYYENRDNPEGFGQTAPVTTTDPEDNLPSEKEIAKEGGSVGGVPLEGMSAPSRTPEGVQYTAKHAKRERKGLMEPNDMSFDYVPDNVSNAGAPLTPVKKEHDEDQHIQDKSIIIRKWFGWFNAQKIAAMGVYMHDNIVMKDWTCTYEDKPAVFNGWIGDFMGYSTLQTKISKPEEIMEDMWKVNVMVKAKSVPVYTPSTNTMIEAQEEEWSYQWVFEFDLPEGDLYPKVMKITRKKNK